MSRLIDADKFKKYMRDALSLCYSDGGEWAEITEDFCRDIDAQPTVKPEPKKSVWIKMSDRDGEYYCCNNCGEELPRYMSEIPSWDMPYPHKYSIDPTDFCPHCGADNRENKN